MPNPEGSKKKNAEEMYSERLFYLLDGSNFVHGLPSLQIRYKSFLLGL
jgi:hypothetical protein